MMYLVLAKYLRQYSEIELALIICHFKGEINGELNRKVF